MSTYTNTELPYDPETSPFGMPIREMAIRCRIETAEIRPLAQTDLALGLRSAFWAQLIQRGCRDAKGSCHRTSSRRGRQPTVSCSHPDSCAVPVLFRPRSAIQRRDHASPVALTVKACGVDAFTVSIVLFGRGAVRAESLVRDAFQRSGERGVKVDDTSMQFSVVSDHDFVGPLSRRLSQILPTTAGPLLMELSAPLDTTSDGLSTVLGNMAHDFVQWDLEDRGLSEVLGKAGCDELAEAARRCASASVERVRIGGGTLAATNVGTRRSRANQHRFPLRGIEGYIRLEGDLTAAAPWLALLSLRGGGRHKSFGLGQVRLWVPSDSREANPD